MPSAVSPPLRPNRSIDPASRGRYRGIHRGAHGPARGTVPIDPRRKMPRARGESGSGERITHMQLITRPPQKPSNISRVRPSPPPVATVADDPDLSVPFARLNLSIARLGHQVLEAVLADPKRESCSDGAALAIRYGLTIDLLPTIDQRIVFGAMRATAPHGYRLSLVLPFARHLLREAGRWQDDLPAFWRGPCWSDLSLVSLAEAWPGPSAVPMLVHRLTELTTAREKIKTHYEYASHLLRGWHDAN